MRAASQLDVKSEPQERRMRALQYWSFARVLLVSVGWVVLWFLVAAVRLLLQFRGSMSSGSGGVGAVSMGFSVPILVIPFGPPVLLMLAWLVARWR
jgi:hypothetical protein